MGMDLDDTEWMESDAGDLQKKEKRASHIRACCAEGCTSKGYRLLIAGERVQYFGFPLFDKSLCARWAAAVRLPTGIPYEKSYLCSKHFRRGDYKIKFSDENKKSLRRTAIPSLEPVVPTGKQRKPFMGLQDSDTDTTDNEGNTREITAVVHKDAENGEDITVLVVKDTAGSETDEAEPMDTIKMPESKKIPLKCKELLAMGPPFPWPEDDMASWLYNRLDAHEEQLLKTKQTADYEEEAVNELEETVENLEGLLAHVIVKKYMGKTNAFQHFKQLIK